MPPAPLSSSEKSAPERINAPFLPILSGRGGVFMSGKRVLALYGALLFCFAAVVCRLYWLCSDTAYGARAAAQSVVTLHLPARRGNFL